MDLAQFCSRTFACLLFDLFTLNSQSLPEKIIDARLIQTQRIVILSRRGNKLAVGIADPSHTEALDQVKFQTGFAVEPVVVAQPQLLELIGRLGQSAEQNLSDLIGEDLDSVGLVDEAATAGASDTGSSEIDDAPVVRFLQKILTDAINMGASDLHFEPFEKFYQIRCRVDDVLREIAQPPLAIKDKPPRASKSSRVWISPKNGRHKMVA